MFITDIAVVKQTVTVASVSFDDDAVADFFEDQVETGRKPEQFARIWLHTHPGCSSKPSGTDEATFQRVFGSCDWSIMAIVAQDNSSYARLRFSTGPGGEMEIPIGIGYHCEFDATDFDLWQQQYLTNVVEEELLTLSGKTHKRSPNLFGNDEMHNNLTSLDLLLEIDSMDPAERQYFMEELAIRSSFWDEYESEVTYE